jgi:hypothetical protein
VISILEGGYSLSTPIAPIVPAKPAKGGHGTRNKRASSNESDDSEKVKLVEKFAQQPGDGGLVKAVLAHVAALAHVENWMEF